MRVYRCIKLQEVINKYTNAKNEKINNNRINTHKYQEDKEYFHFFRYDEFARYYFQLGKDGSYERKNDNYILYMIANIPEEILEKYIGFGFYMFKGKALPIPEYAIPLEEFLPQYIVDISMNPREGNERENEEEEFAKYIELVDKMKSSGIIVKEIAKFFLENNFEDMLEIKIDKRTEKEIEKDVNLLLNKMSFPTCNDDEIEEFKR